MRSETRDHSFVHGQLHNAFDVDRACEIANPLMTLLKRLGLCGDRNDRFGRNGSKIESGVVGDLCDAKTEGRKVS